jgi:hypothetical protein
MTKIESDTKKIYSNEQAKIESDTKKIYSS